MNKLNKQKNLTQFRNELSKKIRPEEIDFGYCIPDCGNCCPKINWMTWIIARGIGEKTGIDENSICSEFNDERYDGQPCPFIYSYNLCIIKELDERHPGCGNYECPHYSMIKEVENLGYDLSGKLKQVWLKNLKRDYNRDAWISKGYYIVEQTHSLITRNNLPIDLIENILEKQINCVELNMNRKK